MKPRRLDPAIAAALVACPPPTIPYRRVRAAVVIRTGKLGPDARTTTPLPYRSLADEMDAWTAEWGVR